MVYLNELTMKLELNHVFIKQQSSISLNKNASFRTFKFTCSYKTVLEKNVHEKKQSQIAKWDLLRLCPPLSGCILFAPADARAISI